MAKLGDQLRAQRERAQCSAAAIGEVAELNECTIYALERGEGAFSSAQAYARALGRKLQIHSARDRKTTADMVAAQTGLSINSVQKCLVLVSSPWAVTDVHMNTIETFLEAIGGWIELR